MGVRSASGQRSSVTRGVGGPTSPKDDRVQWRSGQASLFSAAVLASRRLRSGFRLLLAVGVGIFVAVVLICSVPLYNALISNVQLQASINSNGPVGRNVEIQVASTPFSARLRSQESSQVGPLAAQYLGDFTQPDANNYLTAEPMLLAAVGEQTFRLSAPSPPQVEFEAFDYAQARAHMRLTADSALPQPPPAGVAAPAEALITQDLADDLNAKIGDKLVAAEFGAHTQQIVARIVGIWSPVDPADGYWNGRGFSANTEPPIYPVLLNRDAFTQATSALPDLTVTQHWVYFTVPTRITTDNMDRVAANLGLFKSHLAAGVSALGTTLVVAENLTPTIRGVNSQLALLGLPLYVVVGQIVGLALLYVAAMASLLIEARSAEIATLKSRGASGVQLLGSYAAQGLLLGAVAVVAGPWLAALLAVALIHAFVPAATISAAGVTGAYLNSLAAPAAAVGQAVVGALLGVVVMVATAQRAARLDVLALRREQGRTMRQPIWRRYYLDVGLAVLCAVGYVELGQFGGVQTRQALGQPSNSPLLLGAPALLLLAGALLLLRVFPLAAGWGARVASRGRGATGVLAFAQVARAPAGPSRLALLLALGVGLAVFAITFNASLAQNVSDRAAYQVGADLRLTQNFPEPPVTDARIEKELAAQPGVEGLTPVYRSVVSTTFDEGGTPTDLLAIDPATWQQAAGATSWRDDYASVSLATLSGGLRAHQQGEDGPDRAGQTGAGTVGHPIWALVSRTFASTLSLRVGDRFALILPGSFSNAPAFFVVGAIVQDFPTLYPDRAPAGFVVAGLNDCLGAINTQGIPIDQGPNEYWLKLTSDSARRAALDRFLAQNASRLDIKQVDDRAKLEQTISGIPVQAGMRGLLTVGALAAAALAVLGSIVQSALAARQRVVQFAVLRTLGMHNRQLTSLLLGEQVVVYLFGVVAGTVLGLVLATATLPYLQFSDTTIDPTKLGVPPYILAGDPLRTLEFYAVLAVAFVIALLMAAGYAASIGLGKTLRLGED
jgi:putative ABC transport system permease protein